MFNTYYMTMILALVIGLSLLVFLRWWLRKIERKRNIAIHRDDYDAAVPTSTPHERPRKKIQEKRQKSVRVRFSIIRHLITLIIFLAILAVAVLPLLDRIPAAVFSIFIASSGVIIGIAARPFIENLIAGIVITFSQHLRIGDTVQIDQHYGTIEDITPIYTVIKSWDWRRYIIPNAHMLSKEFTSLTLNDSFRWVYVEFWVAPDTDIAALQRDALQIAAHCEHFADHEDPSFWVMGIEKEGTRCWLAAWANTPGEAWMLASEMRTALAEHFRVTRIARHSYRMDGQPLPPPTPNGAHDEDLPG